MMKSGQGCGGDGNGSEVMVLDLEDGGPWTCLVGGSQSSWGK